MGATYCTVMAMAGVYLPCAYAGTTHVSTLTTGSEREYAEPVGMHTPVRVASIMQVYLPLCVNCASAGTTPSSTITPEDDTDSTTAGTSGAARPESAVGMVAVLTLLLCSFHCSS